MTSAATPAVTPSATRGHGPIQSLSTAYLKKYAVPRSTAEAPMRVSQTAPMVCWGEGGAGAGEGEGERGAGDGERGAGVGSGDGEWRAESEAGARDGVAAGASAGGTARTESGADG